MQSQKTFCPMKKKKESRRQFLKTAPLAALSAALLPGSLGAAPAASAPQSCVPATLDFYGQGPFYTANAPTLQNGQLADANEPGTRLVISGRVKNLACDQWLPNTVLDIWHADDAGAYDNTGYNLRGVTTSNAQGFYMFETILPGKYLNGNQFRPAHIHFKITPPGFPTLITQLYFQGDTSIPGDAAASITSGQYDATARIIPLVTDAQGKKVGTWDIVLDGTGITSVPDLHTNTGMLYALHPNPFTDRLTIRYGVFRAAKVSLEVFDLQGRRVADIADMELTPQKYEATWVPPAHLPNGSYFVVLKVNDLQVHYQRVVKQA